MSQTFDVLSKLLGSDYFTEPDVYILDEHVLSDKSGENEFVVDAAFLAEIAANNNARLDITGDPTPLIIGHTGDDSDSPEKPVVGYATNFRVEPFFDTGRQALLCDFHVPQSKKSVLKDYPRRSVELWPKKREIDPISLLGGTTPERDMGILRFSRSASNVDSISIPYQRECYKMADEKKPEEKDAEKNETSGMRAIEGKLDKLMELLAPLVEALSGAGEEEPPEDEEPKKGDKKDAKDEKHPDEDDLLGPAPQDGEGEEQPGEEQPGEEQPPTSKDAAEYHDTPVKFDNSTYLPRVTKMSRDVANDDVIKLKREVETLKKQNQDIALKYARAEAEKQVAALEAEGVIFAEKNEDIEMLARLSPSAKETFLNKIKKNYARDLSRVEDLQKYSREDAGKKEPTIQDIQREIDAAYAAAKTK